MRLLALLQGIQLVYYDHGDEDVDAPVVVLAQAGEVGLSELVRVLDEEAAVEDQVVQRPRPALCEPVELLAGLIQCFDALVKLQLHEILDEPLHQIVDDCLLTGHRAARAAMSTEVPDTVQKSRMSTRQDQVIDVRAANLAAKHPHRIAGPVQVGNKSQVRALRPRCAG